MLFEIFQIEMPKWFPDFVSLRYRTVNISQTQDDTLPNETPAFSPYIDRLNLVDHYLSLLLIVFIDSGLIEVVITIIIELSIFQRFIQNDLYRLTFFFFLIFLRAVGELSRNYLK